MHIQKFVVIILGIAIIGESIYFGWLYNRFSKLANQTNEQNNSATLEKDKGKATKEIPAKSNSSATKTIPESSQKFSLDKSNILSFLGQNKNRDAIIAQVQKELEQNPNDANAHWHMAQVYLFALSGREKSLPHLTKTLQLQPNHPEKEMIEFWIDLLSPQKQQKDSITEEIEKYKAQLEKNPQDSVNYIKIAELYLSQGEMPKVLMCARKASEVAGNDIENNLAVAAFYENLDAKMALRHLEICLSLNPNDPKKDEIEQKIQKLKQETSQNANNIALIESQLFSDSKEKKRKTLYHLERTKNSEVVNLLEKFVLQETDKSLIAQSIIILRKINTEQGKQALGRIWYHEKCSVEIRESILVAYERYGNFEDIKILENWLSDKRDENLSYQASKIINNLKTRRK